MKKLLSVLFAAATLLAVGPVWASGGDDDGPGDDNGGSNESRVIVRGVIATLSDSSVTVGSSTYELNGSTKYEDDNGTTIALSAFSVGDYVKVKGYRSGDSLIATEMELEDESSNVGDDSRGGKGQDSDRLSVRCTFPNVELLRRAIESSVRTSLKQGGATQVSVKADLRFLNRGSKSKLSPTAIVNGLTVVTDTSGTGPLVDLGGSLAPTTCDGSVRVRLRVRTNSGSQTLTEELAISGVLIKR